MSDVEADLVIGLRKLAGVEGTPGNFDVEHDGFAISVDYMGGSSSRLTLSAVYDRVAHAHVAPGGREASYRKSAKGGVLAGIRPMSITLRWESDGDRLAKEEALSREHQTGDELFDQKVYIDSPTTDAALLDAVLSEATRGAAMELLSLGFDSIVIDDDAGKITALISAFGALRDVSDAPTRVVRGFASLLSGLPPVARAAGEHPERSPLPTLAAIMGGLALVIGAPVGLFGIASEYNCTESTADGEGSSLKDGCGGVAGLAIVLALVAAFVMTFVTRAIARPMVAGHSDSHKRLLTITLAAFAWAAFVAFLLTVYFGYSTMKV